jgi:hypothetical protein
MKLPRIEKPIRCVQVRVVLASDFNAGLDGYARYYQYVHCGPVDILVRIGEILRALLDADREFHSWSRSGQRQPRSVPAPTVTACDAKPAAVLRTCLQLTRHSSRG